MKVDIFKKVNKIKNQTMRLACSNVKVIKYKTKKTYKYTKVGSDKSDCLSMSSLECEAFKLVNNLRANKGLNPLIAVENCISAAQYHSQQMQSNNKLSHDGRVEPWYERIKRFGALGQQMAENIALTDSADRAVTLWANSSTHKRNMLNPVFTHTGVGFSNRYWTQCFLEK